jgi:hypothetical protein
MTLANKVLVTGSSELPERLAAVARDLGHRLMTETSIVLVTGGLLSKGPSFLPALDGTVATAACQALVNSATPPESRIITMLPESSASDHPGFERLNVGTVVRVSYAGLRTSLLSH